MLIHLFTSLPSAPPPGSSHYACNTLIIAKRVARKLEKPVRIKLDGWWKGNPFFDWHERHRHSRVQSMQLRKEKQAPFFHEYTTFKLSDGRCFRIDRRQLPEERSPMDCAVDKGVEAFDTIEQITDLEDSMYSPSECIIQLDFKAAIRLSLIVNVCREIYGHRLARVYTVQRYNCYFYAQTMILCTLCRLYKWEENEFWRPEDAHKDIEEVPPDRMPLAGLKPNPNINIWVSDKHPSNLIGPNPRPSPTERTSFWLRPMRAVLGTFEDSQQKATQNPGMQEMDVGDLQGYLSDMIHAHSARVEHYKFVLKCNAKDVERDIKMGMNEIWSRWSAW